LLLRLSAIALAIALPASAQVADPVPGAIPIGTAIVDIEVVAQLPDSGPGSKPRARPMMLRGDGTGRIFVADQNGEVLQIHPDGSVSTFLDVGSATALVANQGQKGLNGFAFHADYHTLGAAGFGKFYTASSQTAVSGTPDFPVPAGAATTHHSVIHEWDVSGDPDAIDPGSSREVLRIGQPFGDHNVGQIGFNPNAGPGHADEGLLFIAVGDGGNVCCPRPSVDPHFVGQDLSTPLGTLLRIDPLELPGGGAAYTSPASNPFASDGNPNTLEEIWAYGLRNPHRFAFDRGGDGRLLISDIGQANVEEINLGELGANYGWSEREGTYSVMHFDELQVFALPQNDASFGYTYPVLQYDHDEHDNAVSAGYVLRGIGGAHELAGAYLFGDLVSGRVFHAPVDALDGSAQVDFEVLRLVDAGDGQEKSLLEMIGGGTPASRADLRFGLDDEGRIYLLTKQDGVVRRLAPRLARLPSLQVPTAVALVVLLCATSIVVLPSRSVPKVGRTKTPVIPED
jgi:hypothetical protein